jgi:hypothetical protein
MYTDDNYIFQHDSALAHATRTTQEFSKKENMVKFLTLADWLPYLPKLNPLGFSICSI